MIEIAQKALSYYLNKAQLINCFLKHLGQNDPESATSSRRHLFKAFKWFKAPNGNRFSAEACYSTQWIFMNGGENLGLLVLSLKSQRLWCNNYITGCSLTLNVCCYSPVFTFDSIGLRCFNLHLETQHSSLETFINLLLFIKRSFSVTWSFRNHSNMLICCSRNILIRKQWYNSKICIRFQNEKKREKLIILFMHECDKKWVKTFTMISI